MKIINNENKRKIRFLLVILILFFIVNPLFAQRKITIKLASLVPENTAWGAAINRLAAEWARITNGEVEVIVYHNAAPEMSLKFCGNLESTRFRRRFFPAWE